MTKQDQQRAERILDYIRETIDERGYPPSVREIAEAVGLASTSAVHHHLTKLEKDGRLQKEATRSRALTLPGSHAAKVVNAPIVGEIAAGQPIEAYEDRTETMALPAELAPKHDTFVLRVRGKSMIEDHIDNGDYVVIQPQDTARDGEIVVAILDDNTATLKRFYKERDRVRLQPANSEMEPIYARDVKIQGKVIGVIRRLS
ncbi:MAG TPA: transcriptional repressor LexA [Candidatus Saccharimonadales bacterium]|jgi:repressor LexA|nr:transcriptional repressor LexA [Candidatus Saccharimonadales bacterium]